MIHVTSMLCGNPLLILSCLERLQNFRSSNLNSSGETSYVRFVDQRYCGTGCVYYKTMVDYPTASNFMAFICSLRMFGSSYSFVHDADGHLMFRRCSVKAAFNVKCLKKDDLRMSCFTTSTLHWRSFKDSCTKIVVKNISKRDQIALRKIWDRLVSLSLVASLHRIGYDSVPWFLAFNLIEVDGILNSRVSLDGIKKIP